MPTNFCNHHKQGILIIKNDPVIWKKQVYWVYVGAACSRDRFNSRLQAAPTGVFYGCLSLPDKHKNNFVKIRVNSWLISITKTVKGSIISIDVKN